MEKLISKAIVRHASRSWFVSKRTTRAVNEPMRITKTVGKALRKIGSSLCFCLVVKCFYLPPIKYIISLLFLLGSRMSSLYYWAGLLCFSVQNPCLTTTRPKKTSQGKKTREKDRAASIVACEGVYFYQRRRTENGLERNRLLKAGSSSSGEEVRICVVVLKYCPRLLLL